MFFAYCKTKTHYDKKIMKYSDTGKFTSKQIELAKEVQKLMKKAKRLGLVVFANENELQLFKVKEFDMSADFGKHTKYPIPYLSGGEIKDSGAPGEICFNVHEFDD